MNQNPEQIELVKNRLFLIQQLTEAKEHFRGKDKIKKLENRYWTHSYKDFSALRIYLALTCFDILGQPNDWIDYKSWLISKKTKEERDVILNQVPKTENYLIEVYNQYNRIYGVKSSFYKFIRDIISQKDRQKLFESIRTSKQITPQILNKKSTTVATGRRIEVKTETKEKFLFEIRNSFTHKGISIGNAGGGIFEDDKPFFIPGDDYPTWGFTGIHKKKMNGDLITFSVQRWPFVLTEIIENSLEKIEKKNES